MTQVNFARKRKRARRLHCRSVCGALDTAESPAQNCVKHERSTLRCVCDWFSGGSMSRTLIIIGLLIVAVGVLWPWLQKIGLGQLPGDIAIRREGFTFYAPVATCILISIVVSALFWFLRR